MTPLSPIHPVTLNGSHVQLLPLSWDHLPSLCEVGLDPELWRWAPSMIDTPEKMRSYVGDALKAQDLGTALPFVIAEKKSRKVIGSTRFGNIDMVHSHVEIGWTWLAHNWQRTPCNTEAKYLMLCHAFEILGCIRVELKTDVLNERSRAAILRIGAKEEGVLRNHVVTYSGRVRNTVYYSIINSEWPEVKLRLEEKLGRRTTNHQ